MQLIAKLRYRKLLNFRSAKFRLFITELHAEQTTGTISDATMHRVWLFSMIEAWNGNMKTKNV